MIIVAILSLLLSYYFAKKKTEEVSNVYQHYYTSVNESNTYMYIIYRC